MHTKTEKLKFFGTKKIEKPVQKNSQNRKTENPNAPPPPSHSKDAQQWYQDGWAFHMLNQFSYI